MEPISFLPCQMSDFIHEQIVQLNHVLSDLFQHVSASSKAEGSQHDPMAALDMNDQQLFLTCISREIDLLTTVPDISVVKKYLALYMQHPMQGDLAWLFIAKCTVAVYGYMLSNTLNSTLPLAQATSYWNGIYGSKRYETYYALQSESLPFVFAFVKLILNICSFTHPNQPCGHPYHQNVAHYQH